MRDIVGKNIIITGASAGLGRAIAFAFAKAGAHVGLIARELQSLENVQREISATHNAVKVAIAVADTSDATQLTQAATVLEKKLGGIDIWVNNAMETIFSRFDSITPEEFRRVTEVTYLGYVYGTMEALKRMQPKNAGHIIQVGSALAYRAIPLQSAYCGAKFAIRGFTDSLRTELIHNHQDIKLTIVHMPALNTPQFSWARTHSDHQPQPVGTIFEPEVGAKAVLHAAKYSRRVYWVGSSTLAAIVGTLLLPGWMDRKMAKMCYDGQWVKEESPPARPGNLFEPATPLLHTLRGRFSARAKTYSWCWAIIRILSRFKLHP